MNEFCMNVRRTAKHWLMRVAAWLGARACMATCRESRRQPAPRFWAPPKQTAAGDLANNVHPGTAFARCFRSTAAGLLCSPVIYISRNTTMPLVCLGALLVLLAVAGAAAQVSTHATAPALCQTSSRWLGHQSALCAMHCQQQLMLRGY